MKQKLFTLLLAVAASVETFCAWSYDNVALTVKWETGNEVSIMSGASEGVKETKRIIGESLTEGSRNNFAANPGEAMATFSPASSKPGIDASAMIEYSVKMKKGVTFTLTSVEYDAIKQGTNNASYHWAYAIDGVESTPVQVGADDILRDNNTSGSPALHHTHAITAAAGQTVSLRFYVSGFDATKLLCLSDVQINGTINGEEDVFKIGDLYYNLDATNQTAEVTSQNSGNYSGDIVIPASVTYASVTYSVTSIGKSAFQSCTSLTSVTIPNSVTSIGDWAFYGCRSLTSVTIPNSVKSIGEAAFYLCYKLTSIEIPNSVTSIGGGAFQHCSGLTSITIPNSVTSIGGYAFNGCTGLKSVTIPNSVTSIGESAFHSCTGLKSVTIPNSVTSLGNYAFHSCSGLTSIEIPNSVTSIGEAAFYNCSGLTSVTIPNSVTSIRYAAFSGCNGLTSVTIPDSVTSIGEYAFQHCSGLTSITIPNSVTSIGNYAFNGCSSLTSVKIEAETPPKLGWYAFTDTNNSPIYVPCGTLSVYKSAWSDWASQIIYAPLPYKIYKQANNGKITTTDVRTLTICEPFVTCTATANYGYHFTQWSDSNTDNPRTIILTQDTTITAEFARNPTITYVYDSQMGSVTGPATTTTGIAAENITFNATPNYGYHFVQWSDGKTENPRTIWLSQDTTFTAVFAKNTYIISTTSTNSEWGTTSGDKSALYLENVVISATANYGYHFVKWNDNNTYNPRTISVTKDATYTAAFAKNTYSITKIANSAQGSISGVSQAEYLDNITLTVNSNYGYHFTHWSDGNTNNPRTFVLTRDTTFTAEFAADRSGTCGKNNLLQWTFTDDGTLTISGNGELTENYTFGVEAPTQMQQLVIGNEVTTIGNQAFYGKTTLQKLIIGSNVTSIGKYAFANINNHQLTSLVMPSELLTIGDYAFSGNTYLESIDFNAKLQNIGAYAFKDCYRVAEMTCLALATPDLGTDALASINSYASLCVPEECLKKYKVDPNWGRFDLCSLGTTSTVTDSRTVTVEPSDNTAIFTWPMENNAASYSLQITKDGVVFCTLVFNSNGQLTGIAFAPGRNGAAHAPAATMSVAGMSFTVTGLDGASKYAYRLAVTNDASEELVAYSGEFATTGYDGEVNPGGNPEGIEDVFTDEHKASKILHNGQIFILRGEKVYTLQGQEVK